jgi:hypothetical protein
MLLQSGTLTPRGTSTRSRWFNAELLDLSSMTIPELATSLQWSTIWVGTTSNNGDCYTKPLCSTRSIKALLESVFLMTCPLTRASRLPNICPFRQIQSCVNVYKFSFYPRTIVTWNHIPFNILCQSTPSFKTLAMPSIKSLNVANWYRFESFLLYYMSVL